MKTQYNDLRIKKKNGLHIVFPELQLHLYQSKIKELMRLSNGLIRLSIVLDNDIKRTYNLIKKCKQNLAIL
ncbi:MAG: hypothetical protein ABJD66_14525 [Cellulophaga sp.]|uniref:hypothetical protein n=1 Tax=Cellulophaga sp. TaxID=1972202 RepID=UPI00326689F2